MSILGLNNMTNYFFSALIILVFLISSIVASTNSPHLFRKGKKYFSIGYNKVGYANSDVRVKGEDFDFIVHEISASKQEEFTPEFIDSFLNLHGQQFDINFDYFLTDQVQLFLQVRHFKYWADEGIFKVSGDLKKEKNLNQQKKNIKEFLKRWTEYDKYRLCLSLGYFPSIVQSKLWKFNFLHWWKFRSFSSL